MGWHTPQSSYVHMTLVICTYDDFGVCYVHMTITYDICHMYIWRLWGMPPKSSYVHMAYPIIVICTYGICNRHMYIRLHMTYVICKNIWHMAYVIVICTYDDYIHMTYVICKNIWHMSYVITYDICHMFKNRHMYIWRLWGNRRMYVWRLWGMPPHMTLYAPRD